MDKFWQTARRQLNYGEKTLIMGILSVTPDSFSDGGKFYEIDAALRRAETMIEEGADILDIGGESTRPQSTRISPEEETRRVVPIIRELAAGFDIPVSIDTSKSIVARRAVEAGAEIINDISGLRFDEEIAEVAAQSRAGLVLMHLRGNFETMHKQLPVEDIISEVAEGFRWSLKLAKDHGVNDSQIALDVGIGFSKKLEQNLEMIAKLDKICQEFSAYPVLIGTSRKSFLGKILSGVPAEERISGSLSSAAIAVWNGANIVRVHDVRQTVEALKVVEAIKSSI